MGKKFDLSEKRKKIVSEIMKKYKKYSVDESDLVYYAILEALEVVETQDKEFIKRLKEETQSKIVEIGENPFHKIIDRLAGEKLRWRIY